MAWALDELILGALHAHCDLSFRVFRGGALCELGEITFVTEVRRVPVDNDVEDVPLGQLR